MTDRTKQRIEDLRKIFNLKHSDKPVSETNFLLAVIIDGDLMPSIKHLPDDIWKEFNEMFTKDYTPKKEKVVEFDWDCLPKWSKNYIAMDEDGIWYSYELIPSINDIIWIEHTKRHCHIPSEYNPNNFTGDWKDSLMKNPNKH